MKSTDAYSARIAKEAAGKAAADLIEEGMLIGLGTGSTAAYFIARLGERCRSGLKIQAVATSQASHELATALGIPMADLDRVTTLDLTVDGADEIDAQKRMIKGGGGALLREKIVANMSHEMLVVIDESKKVQSLGAACLPVEIVPFAHQATIYKIEQMGFSGVIRTTKNSQRLLTDNHHYIYDIRLPHPCHYPEKIAEQLRSIPGVVETGFFLHLAGRVIQGFGDGRIEIW